MNKKTKKSEREKEIELLHKLARKYPSELSKAYNNGH